MISRVLSAAVSGVDSYIIDVEVDIANGLPSFSVVGLPDAAIRESRDRIKAAIKNTGFKFPEKRITVNLAPSDIRKEGSGFDLPIAIGILAASGHVREEVLPGFVISGQLSLTGDLKSIRGALPITMSIPAGRAIIFPKTNGREAAVVTDKDVYALSSLREVVDFLNGMITAKPKKVNTETLFRENSSYKVDFSDVKGQEHVKRGLEVAASGGHNVLMIGPPGSGKSMLARRLGTILSEMTLQESLETTKIHSVSGLLTDKKSIIATRPFRSPHHTISDAALVGGGSVPAPGEISLAHNGILFLDELPEFKRNVLEVMRQPLEDGEITISRVEKTLRYPARFMLVAAMNPCPCGFFTDPKRECHCTPVQIQRYLSKISGPLIDRIDIHLEVPHLKYEDMSKKRCGEPSRSIRERVNRARNIQMSRFKDDNILFNAHLESRHIEKYCVVDKEAEELLKTAILELGISARAYDKILKVSRTIADLDGAEVISSRHLSEAIGYRSLDRNLWV